jgi:hypothetical protein
LYEDFRRFSLKFRTERTVGKVITKVLKGYYSQSFSMYFSFKLAMYLRIRVCFKYLLHTYHLRFIPKVVAELSLIFLRRSHFDKMTSLWELLQTWQVVCPSPSDRSPFKVWVLMYVTLAFKYLLPAHYHLLISKYFSLLSLNRHLQGRTLSHICKLFRRGFKKM